MKKKIVITTTLVFFAIAIAFAVTGDTMTGLVVSETAPTHINQVFTAIFLFLGLATFILGELH